MCRSDIHFISVVPFHPTHTHVHACASTHTQTRLTKPPTFTPPVESRKCGSVKVTGYLDWLWFPNCLSISRLQFHRCGCPHSLTCCLISESQPPHPTDRPRTPTTMKPIKKKDQISSRAKYTQVNKMHMLNTWIQIPDSWKQRQSYYRCHPLQSNCAPPPSPSPAAYESKMNYGALGRLLPPDMHRWCLIR